MPKQFENCIAKKGRVRRISGPNERFGLKKGQYINICFLGKEMYRGELRTKKKVGKNK